MAKKKASKTIKPTFQVRMRGDGVSPELISIGHVNDALSAIQDLACGRDRYETPTVPVEKQIGLIDVDFGSAIYKCVSPYPDEALTHFQNVAACLSGDREVEPDVLIATLQPLQSLSNVARLNRCQIDVKWTHGRHKNLFVIDGHDYDRIAGSLLIQGETSVAGRLERVGGATDTKCAIRVDGRRHLLYCDVEGNELARRLGRHLYEEIVVIGTAVWLHQAWRIYKFKVKDFVQPRLDDPETMVSDLRDSGMSAWDEVDDPEQLIRGVSL